MVNALENWVTSMENEKWKSLLCSNKKLIYSYSIFPCWDTKPFANLIECYHINWITRTKHLIENHDNLVFFCDIRKSLNSLRNWKKHQQSILKHARFAWDLNYNPECCSLSREMDFCVGWREHLIASTVQGQSL